MEDGPKGSNSYMMSYAMFKTRSYNPTKKLLLWTDVPGEPPRTTEFRRKRYLQPDLNTRPTALRWNMECLNPTLKLHDWVPEHPRLEAIYTFPIVAPGTSCPKKFFLCAKAEKCKKKKWKKKKKKQKRAFQKHLKPTNTPLYLQWSWNRLNNEPQLM